jgi:hypothetical protein
MPTIAEILKQTGMSDEKIAAIDAEVLQKLDGWGTQTISTAQQLKEAAELKQRQVQDYFNNDINPKLNEWEKEKVTRDMETAALRKALDEAKAAGYQVPDITIGTPQNNGQPQRNDKGQFVANANQVPGSPAYLTKEEAFNLQNNSLWAVTEYQRLKGEPIPDDIATLLKEANDQHMAFKDYVNKKYDLPAARQALADKKRTTEIEAIRKEERDKVTKEFAERGGSNGFLRPAATSSFSQIQKAVETKQRPDPLTQSDSERRAATRSAIYKDISDRESQTA